MLPGPREPLTALLRRCATSQRSLRSLDPPAPLNEGECLVQSSSSPAILANARQGDASLFRNSESHRTSPSVRGEVLISSQALHILAFSVNHKFVILQLLGAWFLIESVSATCTADVGLEVVPCVLQADGSVTSAPSRRITIITAKVIADSMGRKKCMCTSGNGTYLACEFCEFQVGFSPGRKLGRLSFSCNAAESHA